jgi:hypothetical protein
VPPRHEVGAGRPLRARVVQVCVQRIVSIVVVRVREKQQLLRERRRGFGRRRGPVSNQRMVFGKAGGACEALEGQLRSREGRREVSGLRASTRQTVESAAA